MKKGKKTHELVYKRELILHAYDSFLIAQTRMFTLAHSTYNYLSAEIKNKQTILLLDDLVQLSIAVRRLFDLTNLKAFSNELQVPLAFFENVSEPKEILRLEKTVSFRRLINAIVHSKEVYLFHDRLTAAGHFRKLDLMTVYRIAERASRENRWAEYSLEPSLFIVPDVGPPLMFCLSDFVSASVTAGEKIVDVCSDSAIFLELEYRGGA